MRLYKIIAVIVHFLLGILLTVVMLVILRWLSQDKRYRQVAQWWFKRAINILGVKLNIVGTPARQTVLYVSNHVSWLDIPLLSSIIDPHFLAKAEVRNWPVIGWLSAKAGTLFIARGNREASLAVSRDMANHINGSEEFSGHSVLFFPEGTTTNGKRVRRFHPRLFGVAIESETKVQPILIFYPDGQGGINPKIPFIGKQSLIENLSGLIKEKSLSAEVHFLDPVEAKGKERRKLALECEQLVRERLEDLLSDVTA